MKVLVTGSSGFIGQAVAYELGYQGHELIEFDRPNHDIRDASDLAVEVRHNDAEAIINLAGMLGTPELFGFEARAVEANVLGAINAYDIAEKYGIPVVQIGTGHKGQPNPYAITKACAEDLGIARARYSHEKIAVVRAYHVYGPGQAAGSPHGKANVHKFFPTFACRAVTNMPLELCGGGGQLIDPVHVWDVAQVLVQAIRGPYGHVIEAGNGEPVSVSRVAQDIYDVVARTNAAGDQNVPMVKSASRLGEPMNANVVALEPRCHNPWPYKVEETIDWYRRWLQRSQ